MTKQTLVGANPSYSVGPDQQSLHTLESNRWYVNLSNADSQAPRQHADSCLVGRPEFAYARSRVYNAAVLLVKPKQKPSARLTTMPDGQSKLDQWRHTALLVCGQPSVDDNRQSQSTPQTLGTVHTECCTIHTDSWKKVAGAANTQPPHAAHSTPYTHAASTIPGLITTPDPDTLWVGCGLDNRPDTMVISAVGNSCQQGPLTVSHGLLWLASSTGINLALHRMQGPCIGCCSWQWDNRPSQLTARNLLHHADTAYASSEPT